MAEYLHVGLGMFIFGVLVMFACGSAIQMVRDMRSPTTLKWDFPISFASLAGSMSYAYVAAHFLLPYCRLLA